MRAKSVNNLEDEIRDLKLKIMYARNFHPEKVHIYQERLKELEGELPRNIRKISENEESSVANFSSQRPYKLSTSEIIVKLKRKLQEKINDTTEDLYSVDSNNINRRFYLQGKRVGLTAALDLIDDIIK